MQKQIGISLESSSSVANRGAATSAHHAETIQFALDDAPASCGGTQIDDFRPRDSRPATSLLAAFSSSGKHARTIDYKADTIIPGTTSASVVPESDSAPASCGATQIDDYMPRDVRPSTSLFGAFSFSKNIEPAALSNADTAESSAALRLEHFTVLTREDGTPWELGRGAMGVTYKALDTRLHCHVALKSISADLIARSAEARERFLREARAAARLRHSNVASVFHLGETPEGHAFYAMEFIEGETLDARVRRRGPLPANLAVEVGIGVARGLIAAGQQGLIHRDLKPANLMLVAGAEDAFLGAVANSAEPGSHFGVAGDAGDALVKVIDFGLAKVAADGGPATRAEAFLGTPQLASPEQFSDNDASADARSDIYSLGATLWFALTGKFPFPGKSVGEVRSCQLTEPLPIAQLNAARVPEPLIALLASMLAADPVERPQTPYALLDALRRCRVLLHPCTPRAALASSADSASKVRVRVPRATPPVELSSSIRAESLLMIAIGVLLLTCSVVAVWYLH